MIRRTGILILVSNGVAFKGEAILTSFTSGREEKF